MFTELLDLFSFEAKRNRALAELCPEAAIRDAYLHNAELFDSAAVLLHEPEELRGAMVVSGAGATSEAGKG